MGLGLGDLGVNGTLGVVRDNEREVKSGNFLLSDQESLVLDQGLDMVLDSEQRSVHGWNHISLGGDQGVGHSFASFKVVLHHESILLGVSLRLLELNHEVLGADIGVFGGNLGRENAFLDLLRISELLLLASDSLSKEAHRPVYSQRSLLECFAATRVVHEQVDARAVVLVTHIALKISLHNALSVARKGARDLSLHFLGNSWLGHRVLCSD